MALTLLVATALGFLSGLGLGGGSLLILWLTLALGMGPEAARRINLLFFLPTALIAVLFRRRQGAVDHRKLLPGICAGCVAAFFLSQIRMDTSLLKKLFGGLLIATGLRELFYKNSRAGS